MVNRIFIQFIKIHAISSALYEYVNNDISQRDKETAVFSTFMMSSRSSSQRTNTLEEDERGSEVDSVTASWARRRARAALLASFAFFT